MNIRPLPLIIFLLLTFVTNSVAQNLQQTIRKATFLIEQHQQQTQTPGVQVAVIKQGQLIWSEAFGYRDLETQDSLSVSDPMRIASVSKPVTSVALGKLVETGQLNLDADIRSYVPEFPDKRASITARQLAGSIAGVRHYNAEDPTYNQTHYDNVIEALDKFKDDPLLFEPGTDYHYSSYGWVLLSAVMERAAGKPFPQLMQETWSKLDMQNTYLDNESHQPTEISDQYIYQRPGLLKRWFTKAKGQRIPVPEEDRSFMYAGGGYLSTAEDLVNMGWKLINGSYLESETVEELFTSLTLENGTSTHYGLGWETGMSRKNTPIVFHSGSMSSARSHLVIYPEQQLVFALVMNTGDRIFFNEREAHSIAELFLAEQPSNFVDSAITGTWKIRTTSLRDKKTTGKLTISESVEGLITGEITFKRSTKQGTHPLVLTDKTDSTYHFISVTPMFMDLYLKFDGNQFTGQWLHDFNIKGASDIDPYWDPRTITGKSID